ncbi:MAG: acyltransferase family protein [Eubacteriales bacterium]|nr:acyltransferase family protein [Eubacteriales bacterium]
MKGYDNIRLLRAAACLGVFITHLAPYLGVTGRAAWLANQGAAGVYLFFLISGFLAAGDRRLTAGRREIFGYYRNRLLRLLPLYYAVILYNMALHGLLLRDVPSDPKGLYWLRYFFLTNAVLPAPDNFWGNLSATWTISLFAAFYLLAPFFVRLIRGVGSAFFAYALALLLRYLWTAAGLSDYMMIFYYLHFFLLGILVRQIAGRQRLAPRLLLFGAAMAAIAAVLWLTGTRPDSFLLYSWAFGAIVLLTLKLRCSARGVLLADAYSYEIYLVHAVVLEGIGLLRAHIAIPAAVVLILAVGLTAAGAFLAKKAEGLLKKGEIL